MRHVLLVVMVFLGLGQPARAEEGEVSRTRARSLFLEGKRHYAASRFGDAILAFTQAGALQPSPLLDYNIARCHDRLGHRAEALKYYQQYLRARPNAQNRAEVQGRISALKRPRTVDPYEDLERKAAPKRTRSAASQPVAGPPAGRPTGAPAMGQPDSLDEARRSVARPPTDPAGRSALPPHEAALGRRPPPAPYPYRYPYDQQRRPLYKQWWFWAIVGGGAALATILVVASMPSGHHRGPSGPIQGQTTSAGLTAFSF